MSVGIHIIDYEIAKDFGYLEHIQRYSCKFLASVGNQELFDFFSFLYQVDPTVWGFLAFSMVLVILSSAISDAFLEERTSFLIIREQLHRTFWIYLASLFCEGSPRAMSSRRAQLIQFLWLFVILVLVNMLYSQFKGILMVKVDDGYLRSIQDLASRVDIVPMLTENSVVQYIFRDSPLEAYKQVYRNALRNPKEAFIEVAKNADLDTYQLVKDGTHVLGIADFYGKIMLSKICWLLTGNRRLYFMDEEFCHVDTVFYVNWDFPADLKDLLTKRLMAMKETGFSEKWFSESYRGYEKCDDSSSNENEEFLKLVHLKTAFDLYLGLHALSFQVLIFEKIFCRK